MNPYLRAGLLGGVIGAVLAATGMIGLALMDYHIDTKENRP